MENIINECLQKLNLTCSQLADKLGIHEEKLLSYINGQQMDINILKQLNDLLNGFSKKNKQITKIVITGGPCAGKTTALSKIEKEFTQMGYSVVFVSETATEIILNGITPTNVLNLPFFQEEVLKLQLYKEKLYEEASYGLSNEKILIICDRGALDGKAFISDLEFSSILKKLGISEIELRDNYDAVFHLTTAAKGAEKYYTLENNRARYETLEEAIISDDNIISSWIGHPHFRVIDNSTDFDFKIKRLIKEIKSFLGLPIPYEIERKFLIEYPDLKWLDNNKNCQKVEIIQTYLYSNKEEEIRIRQRGIDGNYLYYQTIKRNINDLKRIELERKISKDEYLNLLMNADPNKRQIRKTRYCLLDNNQYFEIDVYPNWHNKAIVEVELSDEELKIEIPKQLKLIKEVTNDKNYRNSVLANL